MSQLVEQQPSRKPEDEPQLLQLDEEGEIVASPYPTILEADTELNDSRLIQAVEHYQIEKFRLWQQLLKSGFDTSAMFAITLALVSGNEVMFFIFLGSLAGSLFIGSRAKHNIGHQIVLDPNSHLRVVDSICTTLGINNDWKYSPQNVIDIISRRIKDKERPLKKRHRD